jgi:hypothetical protein
MNTETLVEGYKALLKSLYAPEEYYRRVLRFLEHRGPSAARSIHKFSDYVAVAKSLLWQGLLDRSRFAYWRFLANTLLHHRRSFDTAMALAIMGYHLRRITESYCEG